MIRLWRAEGEGPQWVVMVVMRHLERNENQVGLMSMNRFFSLLPKRCRAKAGTHHSVVSPPVLVRAEIGIHKCGRMWVEA